jgi:hypothetical protein
VKTQLVAAIAIVCLGTVSLAQQQGKNSLEGMPLNERIFFGGGGSFNGGVDVAGNRYTYLAVNPLAGYRITVPFSMGVAINYALVSYPDIPAKASQYGVSPFAQYRIGRIFGYAEYSFISVPNFDNSYRSTYKRFPVGLGYTQPIGPKAAINVMALYDLRYARNNTFFTNPFIIRIFITAGGISI